MRPRRLVAVSWCMPPALFPRSIQVARLLKGLRALRWFSTVVTARMDDVSGSAVLDRSLSDVYPGQPSAPVDGYGSEFERPEPYRRWTSAAADGAPTDADLTWAKTAAATVRRVDRSERADALVTFAQPWRDHLVGLELLRWRGRRPWVAHFSDPWADSPYAADAPPEEKQRQLERETQVVHRADVLVFTNQYGADLTMAKYPDACRRKVRVVPHAMDRDLLPHAGILFPRPPRDGSGPLRLSHVGNLFIGRRTAHGLFEAVAALHRRRPLEGRLELVFVGEGSGWEEARERASALGLDAIVTFHGRVGHLESLAAMKDTDALLLIDAPAARNVFMPSKLVDYLMAEKPILALSPPIGPSADVVRQLGYPVVEPTDVAAITDALEGLLQDRATRRSPPLALTRACVERFSLETTAAAFAAILDDAVRARSGWMHRWHLQ